MTRWGKGIQVVDALKEKRQGQAGTSRLRPAMGHLAHDLLLRTEMGSKEGGGKRGRHRGPPSTPWSCHTSLGEAMSTPHVPE